MFVAHHKTGITVVVEAGFFPGFFCMTTFTLVTQAAFVGIFLTMAATATGWGFLLIQWSTMTIGTACLTVTAQQLELGIDVMAEYQLLPAGFLVTTFVTLTERGLVLVILTMA